MTDTVYLVLATILAVYEVLARVIPTEGNWTIVHNLVKVIDLIIKNRSTLGTEFTVAKIETPVPTENLEN